MGFNWDEEQQDEFRDMPEEVNGNTAQGVVTGASQMSMINKMEPLVQSHSSPTRHGPVEELALPEISEEDEYEAVLNDANLRIEQGTLYKLIMNHNLFEGRDEDPRAIENVQREIRKFAKERLEIMLGMRQDTAKQTIISSPFNDLEVMVLRKLASTYSKGATEDSAAVNTATVVAKSSKKEGLSPIIGSKPQTKSVQKPLPVKSQSPVRRDPVKPAVPVLEGDYKPLDKSIHEMTDEEKIQRNKEVSLRQVGKKSVRSASALPQPTPDQEEMFHTQRVMTSDNPLANSNVVSAIVAKLNQSKSQ